MLKRDKKIRVLIVEDDSSLGFLLCENFKANGIATKLIDNGKEAIQILQTEIFDLCILDIMLPGKDGFAVAAILNSQKPNIPFIFLTSMTQDTDKHHGFEIGADDYITKPFNFKELHYRVLAVMRRKKHIIVTARNTLIEVGPLIFNPATRELKINDNARKVSHREAGLLHMLLENNGEYINRYEILNRVWGTDSSLAARSMEVYITRLRKLLKEVPAFEIENLYGEGYRIVYKQDVNN